MDISINRLLKIPEGRKIHQTAKIVRPELINNCIKLPDGIHTVWSDDTYSIQLQKPGKEVKLTNITHHADCTCLYHDESNKGPNVNDMKPLIYKHGQELETPPMFEDIFEQFQIISDYSKYALELIGCLIFRNAFTLDHKQHNHNFKYSPAIKVLNEIENELNGFENLPDSLYKTNLITFLHFIDSIATNEDVKYHTLGYQDVKNGGATGRRNNLLTYVNVIAVLLRKVPLAKFAGSFARPPSGVSAFTYTKIKLSKYLY